MKTLYETTNGLRDATIKFIASECCIEIEINYGVMIDTNNQESIDTCLTKFQIRELRDSLTKWLGEQ